MPYVAPDPSPPAPLPPHVVAAIARAERRREMLERLSDLGMQLAEDIAARAARAAPRPAGGGAGGGEDPPEPRHEPGRAFAAVSRTVRLTLALEARIDEQILALMRGDAAAAAAKSPGETPDGSTWTPRPPPDAFARRRTRIGACVWDAIEEGMTDPAAADDLCLVVQERLMESETYDALFFRPFRESVEAICKDLGLQPDWSRWDDEAGFPPETRRTDHDFTSMWATWPSGAKARRAYYASERRIAAAKADIVPKPVAYVTARGRPPPVPNARTSGT